MSRAVLERQQIGLGLPDQAPSKAEGRASGRFATLRGDVYGGITAGLISVPASMGYALLAFAPLGTAFFPEAVRAGLVAIVVGCAVAVLFGGRTTLAYAPRSVVAFLIGAILLQSADAAQAWAAAAGDTRGMFVIILLVIALAGAIQALFGLLRLGNLVKYIPAPVVAGFQNAAAILILLSQFDVLLGLDARVPVLSIAAHADRIQPLTLAVGILTCVVSLKGARLVPSIPPTILSLAVGTITYYALIGLGFGAMLGSVIGPIPVVLPDPRYALELASTLTYPGLQSLLPILIGGAVSIAVVASLDATLCSRVVAADSGGRFDGNRELLRLGAGNFVAPLFGGMAVGINLAASFASHRAGARTRVSVAVHAGFVLLCLVLLPPVIERMPRVVIAGMLLAVAIQLVDRWTLKLIGKLARGEAAHRPRMLIDLAVILIVAVVAIAADLILAVLLGMSVAVIFFLFRMSRTLVRRAYRGDGVRSRRTRDPTSGATLAAQGGVILVLELEGAIFFGTAERLADLFDRELAAGARYLVLDLKRVQDIDSTGARVLLQAHDRFAREGRYLLIAGLWPHSTLGQILQEQGVLAAVTPERQFEDVDRALEWAEDRLLLELSGGRGLADEFPFGQLDLLRGMESHEISTVRTLLRLCRFEAGATLFQEGEPGTDLYIVVSGKASARLPLAPGRELRLITFSAGTVFGELGLLDLEPRSATVVADGELICYVLSRTDFVVLTRMYPTAAIKLLRNLGRELSYRLRWANRTVFELDS